jgi:hypothetical protein
MKHFLHNIILAAVAGLMAGAVVLAGLHYMPAAQAQNSPTVTELLQARRLEIVDAAKRPRIVLSVDEQGIAGVALLDEKGAIRSGMLLAKDGKAPAAPEQPTVIEPPTLDIDPALTLVEAGFQDDTLGRVFAGAVKNTADHAFKSVELKVTLYDYKDVRVGEVSANTGKLEPGHTWKFHVGIGYMNAAKYTVKVLLGRQ